jgi:GAF domain-containing protein
VSVPTDDPDVWRAAATEGSYARWQGSSMTVEGTVTGAAIAAHGLVVVADPGSDPRTSSMADAVGVIGETVAVPMVGDGGISGVLAVSRRLGDEPFDGLDRDLITAVAAHTVLALHLAQANRDNEQLRLIEDREQIAEDLRHHLIRRLFGHGLVLQATASRTNPNIRTAIQTQIYEVDAIIRDIRAAVFPSGRRSRRPLQSTSRPTPANSALSILLPTRAGRTPRSASRCRRRTATRRNRQGERGARHTRHAYLRYSKLLYRRYV